VTRTFRPWAAKLGTTEGPAATLLTLLWGTCGLLIAAHLSLKVLARPSGHTWDLGVDRGYGELFGYLLTAWSGFLLARVALRDRAPVLAVWSSVCVYLLADDWFQLHEAFGVWFERRVPALGTLSNHVGELAFLGVVGVVLASLVAVTHLRARPAAREVSAVLAVLFALFAFCSMVVDALHAPFLSVRPVDVALTTLEDGGEILVLSAVAAFLFAVESTGHRPHLHGRWARWFAIPPESSAHDARRRH